MEDFIEIIFYVVILVLSGIGSLVKSSKNKKQQSQSQPQPSSVWTDDREEADVVENRQENRQENKQEDTEAELIRMLREVAEAASRQQDELEKQQKKAQAEELRRKEIAEKERKAALIRAQRDRERALQQEKIRKAEINAAEDENGSVFDLNLSDVDDVRKAFIASEIFNKKYC